MNLIYIKQVGLILVLLICGSTLVAQPKLKLKQKKSSTNFRIVNGAYEMFISQEDIIEGIAFIEKVLEVDYQTTRKKIEMKNFNSIDLKKIKADNLDFVQLLSSNLGVLLFSKEQVVVYKDGKILKQIDTEEAPPKQSLDGVTTRTVYYLMDRNQKPFFIGEANMKVAGYK